MISDNSLFFSLFSSSNFFCNLSFCIWACTVLYFSLSMAAFKMRNPIYSNSPFLYLTSRGQADLQQWLFRGVLESTVAFCRDHARWHMNKKVSHYCQGCVRELVGNSGWHWCFFLKNVIISSRGVVHIKYYLCTGHANHTLVMLSVWDVWERKVILFYVGGFYSAAQKLVGFCLKKLLTHPSVWISLEICCF